MANTRIVCVSVAALSVLVYVTMLRVRDAGYHLHYYKHHPGNCSVVPGAGLGSENLDITSGGLAFITSGNAFVTMAQGYLDFMTRNNMKGRVLLYDVTRPQEGAQELTIVASGGFDLDVFRPHGISVLEDDVTGRHLVYVINHPFPQPDAVEKFRFEPKTKQLIHIKSITDAVLRTTNDLALVGEDKFYISNFLYFKDRTLVFLETLLHLPLGGLLYYDGSSFSTAAGGLVTPNGVYMAKDNRYVYVAMFLEKQVRVYRRDDDDSLDLVQTVDTYTLSDNFNIGPDGSSLVIAAHPINHVFFGYEGSPGEKSAPSHVLSFPLKDGLLQASEAEELFYDDGQLIKASTVAAVYKGRLLVGSLIDQLVVCAGA